MSTGPLEDRALNLLRFLGAEQARPNSKYVLVMGTTGSGKSTFISRCTGQDAGIGHELKSCTEDVGVFRYWDGSQDVYLVDTPGFDDTSRSDIDTLRIISYFLGVSYANGNRIDGIIYLHRISDVRFTGSSRRTVEMLKALSGPKALSNVTIATTMWSSLQRTQHVANEMELISESKFFGQLLRRGARLDRHAEKGTGETEEILSAKAIIESALRHSHASSRDLQIQREMINLRMSLDQTAAGMALLSARGRQTDALRKQCNLFEQQVKVETQAKNKKAAADFTKEFERTVSKIKQIETENIKLDTSMEQLHDVEAKKLLVRIDKMEQRYRASSKKKDQKLQDLESQLVAMKDAVAKQRGNETRQKATSKATNPKPNLQQGVKPPKPTQPSQKHQDGQAELLRQMHEDIKLLKSDLVQTRANEVDARAAGNRLRDRILPVVAQAAVPALITGALGAVACSVM